MKFWKTSLRSPRSFLLPRLSSPSSPSLSSQQRGSSPPINPRTSSGIPRLAARAPSSPLPAQTPMLRRPKPQLPACCVVTWGRSSVEAAGDAPGTNCAKDGRNEAFLPPSGGEARGRRARGAVGTTASADAWA